MSPCAGGAWGQSDSCVSGEDREHRARSRQVFNVVFEEAFQMKALRFIGDRFSAVYTSYQLYELTQHLS